MSGVSRDFQLVLDKLNSRWMRLRYRLPFLLKTLCIYIDIENRTPVQQVSPPFCPCSFLHHASP